MSAPRISPRDYWKSKGDMLLVCAYEDDAKFDENHLESAISLSAFEARLDSIPKDSTIVFY